MKITDYIPYGRANAISMPNLSKQLGIKPRECRRWVQREREQGAPICSDWEHGGYFMPANECEARSYYRQQRSRIKSARAALNGVIKYLREGNSCDE